MKIETIRACEINLGDMLAITTPEVNGCLWKVVRALTGDDEGHREFLLKPLFNQTGIGLQCITPKHSEKLTVWKTTEVK